MPSNQINLTNVGRNGKERSEKKNDEKERQKGKIQVCIYYNIIMKNLLIVIIILQTFSLLDPVYFPSNAVDITPEHFHDFLSLASSPPLPSPMSKSLNPGARVFTPSKDNDKGKDTARHSLQDQEPVSISTSFAQALARGEKKWSPNPKPVITTSVGMLEQF